MFSKTPSFTKVIVSQKYPLSLHEGNQGSNVAVCLTSSHTEFYLERPFNVVKQQQLVVCCGSIWNLHANFPKCDCFYQGEPTPHSLVACVWG